MSNVTLKDLKEDLSTWAEKAAAGEMIHVTKYNKPYIVLGPSDSQVLRVGGQVGKGSFSAVTKEGLGGLSLKYLEDDRSEG